MAKTFDVIIEEMASTAAANLNEQDTRTGTVLREAFLAPVASQLEAAYARTDQVELNQSIASAESITDVAMESLAANFGLARFPGSASSGVVRFIRFQAPLVPISIPSGTSVSTTSSGDNLSFVTIVATTLSNVSLQDPVTNAYYVDVPVQATVTGTAGNVDSDTVTVHSVPSIDDVTNPNAMSGGKDQQTNTELAELIAARAQGNLGTRSGYENLVRNNFSVDDMNIITPTDPEALRAEFGGELDITILSGNFVESQETAASTTTIFYPTFLPLVSVTSIIGVENITDSQIPLVDGVDYDVVLDTYSPLSRSYLEKSRINLHVVNFTVKPASVFTIVYKNSELMRVIQSFIGSTENAILGADVLVKLANKIGVNITADIRIIPGFDAATVQSDVTDAVTSFLNAKLLDDDIQESDVTGVIGGVAGVDSVDLATFKMAKSSAPLTYIPQIVANKQEYLRAGIITIVVVG
jgi:uncharacterized phage protein gp47/JayE